MAASRYAHHKQQQSLESTTVPPQPLTAPNQSNAPDINSSEFKALEAAVREHSAHKFSVQIQHVM